MIADKFYVSLFLSSLEELVYSGICLEKALVVLTKTRDLPKKLSFAANEILESLKSGHTFSFALSSCSSLNFCKTYINFISCAEKTGNICETLAFIKKIDSEKKENLSQLKLLVSYPIFVLVLVFFLTFAIFEFGEKNFPEMFSSIEVRKNLVFSVINGGSLVFLLCGLWSFFVFLVFKNDTASYVFNALYFLTKSGISLSNSLNTVMAISYSNSKIQFFLTEVLENLKNGKPAFCNLSCKLDCFSSMILSLGTNVGSLENSFKTISLHYEKKTTSLRQLIIRFSEPFLLCTCGIYLVILFLNCNFLIFPEVF